MHVNRLMLIAAALVVAVRPLVGAEVCVWQDEFAGETLNTAYWTAELNFVRNKTAAQIYTARPENLTVKDGSLRLTARHESFENTQWKPESSKWFENRKSAEYTSASVNSRGKVAFRYGRLEIRARVEHGRGVWPAIWLLGNNPGGWPACGEIDILEYISQRAKTVHATCHYRIDDDHTFPTKRLNGLEMDGVWHTYGMAWSPEKIVITFDGKPFYTLDVDETVDETGFTPFRQGTFYLIMNLALDGWAERPRSDDYPRTFSIDYVRLYQDPEMEGTLLEISPKK